MKNFDKEGVHVPNNCSVFECEAQHGLCWVVLERIFPLVLCDMWTSFEIMLCVLED